MSVKITKLKETKRGRIALFDEEEEFLFSIDGETLIHHDIREGCSLSDGELSLLRSDSDTRKAKDAALRYLSLRAYGEKELYDKLCLKYDPHSAAAAIATMVELDLLDDETFAEEKAKGMAGRGKSSMEIRRKLQSLGLADFVIENAMAGVEIDDLETASRLVHKSYMEKLRRGQKQNVMAALARRGFGHRVCREAVETALAELEEADGEAYDE